MIVKCLRAAKREDMAVIADMIRELAVNHKRAEAAKLFAKDLEQDGFSRQPPASKCKVAEIDQAIVGYTIYFPIYSSWYGDAMLLEDLYVQKKHQTKGIGNKLFNAVAKEAADCCSQLDLMAGWNGASEFHKEGAVDLTKQEQWCYSRQSGEALKRFAEKIV